MSVFSDTTNKSGLIQKCERHCAFNDGRISGDTTLLKQFTDRINDAYDEIVPLIFASEGRWQFDDLNHTDMPIATTNIVSGQRVYTFTSDENSNSILTIDSVSILTDATTTDYSTIRPIDTVDTDAKRLLEDNSTNVGVPTKYDKVGNTIVLDATPNYASTNGIKIHFHRSPSYFASTDTTKTAGIPSVFVPLLALIASHEWMFTFNQNESTTISRLEQKIQDRKMDLQKFLSNRSKDETLIARPMLRNPA